MPINNNWDIFGAPDPAPEPVGVYEPQEHLVGMGPAVIWDNYPAPPVAQEQLDAMQGGNVPLQAPPNQLHAINQALGGNPFNANAQAYYNQAYKDIGVFTKKSRTKADPSVSPLSDEYQALTYQIEGLKENLVRESEELASALEKIATQVEVVRDIGSLIHSRISSLQKAASRLENWRQSLPRPDSLGSLQEPPASRYEPVQVGPPAQAGQVQVGPGLWQQGQV